MSKNDDALRCAEAAELSCGRAMDELRRLVAENEALRESVKKANEQAEHFERQWYLRGDENEAQAALLRQAVYALSYHQEQTRPIFNTQQAIAAIRQHLETDK